ncbi:MAG: hypothetical protein ACFFG0_01725 [Candidatus Thorarchaeota archaeon]
MGIEEYSDLGHTGFQGGGGEKVAPEDEFFHSVYVSASERKNHINVVEKTDKFQIRGVQYNLDEVHMVITHTKEILANIKTEKGRDSVECFSFKEGPPPWHGTTRLPNGDPRPCPQTSAERAVVDFCNPCRAQIIVAGVYCKEDGTPILADEKPIFLFIRGKGMRYSNVSQYLGDLYNEELPPLFTPVTEQTQAFEKSVVNNKRFVTKITSTKEQSSYKSLVNVFVLTKGKQLDDKTVKGVLKLSKRTLENFNEKFDWSRRKGATGYGSRPEGVLPVDGDQQSESKSEDGVEAKAESTSDDKKEFSFEDIDF